MKNENKSRHIATSPKAKQEIRKFKEEFSEDLLWDEDKRKFQK